MKVLVAGPDWFGQITQFCEEAFSRIGCETEAFYWDKLSPRHLKLLGGVPDDPRMAAASINGLLLHDVDRFRPDFIFIVYNVSSPLIGTTFEKIRRAFKIPVAAWLVDQPFREYSLVKPLGHVDHLFTWEPSLIEPFELLMPGRVSLLPHGAPTWIYAPRDLTPEERERYGCGLSFVGSCWEGGGYFRARMLEALRDFPLRVYGAFWENVRGEYPDLGPKIVNTPLAPKEVNALYNASEIVLNIHHPQGTAATNPRTFEAAASGAFQLADHRRGHERFFKPGQELVTYKSFDELRELVRYYLDRPEEARQIAERARRRVLAEHSLEKRMALALERMGAGGRVTTGSPS